MVETDFRKRAGRAVYSALFWLGLFLLTAARAPETDPPSMQQHCLACGKPTTESDPVLTVRGRTVALCAGHCKQMWDANPEQLFAKLQPAGALFTEERQPNAPLGDSVFWIGVFMVSALFSAAGSAYIAVNRGHFPANAFVIGLVGNLAGLLYLLFSLKRRSAPAEGIAITPGLTKTSVTHAPRACRDCGAPMHPSARKCSACGSEHEPLVGSEVPV